MEKQILFKGKLIGKNEWVYGTYHYSNDNHKNCVEHRLYLIAVCVVNHSFVLILKVITKLILCCFVFRNQNIAAERYRQINFTAF